MDSILQISIRDYKLINLDEVYKLTDIQYIEIKIWKKLL